LPEDLLVVLRTDWDALAEPAAVRFPFDSVIDDDLSVVLQVVIVRP